MGFWGDNKFKISFIFLYSVCDFGVTTVLYGHLKDYMAHFSEDVYHFIFTASMFELWIFSVARLAITLGYLLGVLCNKTEESVEKVNKYHYGPLLLAVLMWTYTVIKMLAFSEEENTLKKPWFWSLFGWTLFCNVMLYVNIWILGNFTVSPRLSVTADIRNGAVNSDDEETEPLLNSTRKNGKTSDEEGDEKKIPTKKKASNVWRLIKYSRPDLFYIVVAFIFMNISSLAEVFTPWYTGQVIQAIAIDRDWDAFIHAIIYMGLFSAASSVAAGVRGGFFKIAIARFNIRVRNNLFGAILKQEVGFFDANKTGELTSRLTSDTTIMAESLGLNANVFMRSVIKAIGVCVFMFRISWRMSMLTLMGLPIIMGVSDVWGKYYQKLTKQTQESYAKANEVAEEVYSSLRTVRSFACESYEVGRYADKMGVTYGLNKKEALGYAGYTWGTQLFSLSLVIGTLYYGGHLVVHDLLTGGELVSFILYQMELGYALEAIGWVYSGLMQAVGASEKVFEFIDRVPEIKNDGKLAPEKLVGKLEFRNVTFAYPSRPETDVIKNVSFEVSPGEVVALVGHSGGGKSSCVNLIEHFYETKSGQVLLDDIPIKNYDHGYLHKKISLVGQEPVLYARSIKENIAYGLDTWDDSMVRRAAEMANAHQFIMEMKDGYDTEAGEKGQQLSGGQKQRIAIARAIIRNPTILLLDEATSALDSESEHVVQQAMYNNLKGRTVIIIAHRLSTVERASRIIVINKGQVIEQGTHKQLLNQGGMYAKLVRRQLLGFEDSLDKSSDWESSRDRSGSYGSFKSVNSVDLEHERHVTDGDTHSISPKFGTPKYGSPC